MIGFCRFLDWIVCIGDEQCEEHWVAWFMIEWCAEKKYMSVGFVSCVGFGLNGVREGVYVFGFLVGGFFEGKNGRLCFGSFSIECAGGRGTCH